MHPVRACQLSRAAGETQLAWRAKERHRLDSRECAMKVMTASILWRRLDVEGHDACLLSQGDGGHSLQGQAIFVQDGKPCCLAYEVICDAGWRTRSARVDGFLGMRKLHYAIERRADGVANHLIGKAAWLAVL